jgi:hypothetical protein
VNKGMERSKNKVLLSNWFLGVERWGYFKTKESIATRT